MTLRTETIRSLLLAVIVLAASMLVSAPCTAIAQDEGSRVVNREYYLKAAFLLHFTTFIEWPEGELDNNRLEIGVLGQDPFGEALQTINGKLSQGRRIVIRRSQNLEDLESCAVIFIARSEQPRLREILADMNGQPVLTVSDIEGFAGRWGVINFTTASNRVGFEINRAAAGRSGLRVSSRLLRVATIVEDLHPMEPRP